MIRRPPVTRPVAQLGFCALACLVAGLALYPNLQLPEPSLTRGFTDKIYHLFGCTALVLLAARGWRLHTQVVVLALPLSALLELVQVLVPGRGVHLADMLANFAGVGLAILILRWSEPRALFRKPAGRACRR